MYRCGASDCGQSQEKRWYDTGTVAAAMDDMEAEKQKTSTNESQNRG
mgnify:CR=1 FL=1